MHYHKVHHPENFRFARRYAADARALRIGRQSFPAAIAHLGEDVFRLDIGHRQWPQQYSQAELTGPFDPTRGACRLAFDARGGLALALAGADGHDLLRTAPGSGFGVSGKAWMFKWAYDPAMQFYGMGEKCLGLELTGRRTRFWNTDLWADFHYEQIIHHAPDPMYLSIPYLIIKQGNGYVGVLVNSPYAVFMATNPNLRIASQSDAADQPDSEFFLGAPDGQPSLFFIVGPTLADLTRKYQRLCGTTPRPPLWALGHHQCRWGYRNFQDLEELDANFQKHDIPCDGLWLDIDYMRGFRVFTVDAQNFSDPPAQLAALRAHGRHIVPILDPGVKKDPKFPVYQDGLKADIFCRNPAGTPYVGFVWPGATVFPDFSIPEGRAWWAGQVARFAALGFDGAWIDMNDPSTGASESSDMLFDRGRAAHDTYHNQYALGMAQATRDGFLQARPEERPFVISRSGFIALSRYAAAWTGDNYSNEHHLRNAIPTSLNLALSGVPFNGPDVPGFMGDATPELAIAWYKAGFLFPFFRNHTACGTRRQEPWEFGPEALEIIRHYIRLRYKLLPYIYQLFVAQEARGTAILRPLFHDFDDTPELPLGKVADQFLLGPALMHAPLLAVSGTQRPVVLPAGAWFDCGTGQWLAGGRTLAAACAPGTTPLFVRAGSLVPMAPGWPPAQGQDLATIEVHIFRPPGHAGASRVRYLCDDGHSRRYLQGAYSAFDLLIEGEARAMTARFSAVQAGYQPLRVRLVTYAPTDPVRVEVGGAAQTLAWTPMAWRMTGAPLAAWTTPEILVGA